MTRATVCRYRWYDVSTASLPDGNGFLRDDAAKKEKP